MTSCLLYSSARRLLACYHSLEESKKHKQSLLLYDDVSIERLLSVVLVLRGIGPILRNGYGNQGQKMCCIAPGN